jgi:hypothetical protein
LTPERRCSLSALDRLLAGLKHPDPNNRIAALRSLDGELARTPAERHRLYAAVIGLLDDQAQDDFCYACRQSDEEEPAVTVGQEARAALFRLTGTTRKAAGT